MNLANEWVGSGRIKATACSSSAPPPSYHSLTTPSMVFAYFVVIDDDDADGFVIALSILLVIRLIHLVIVSFAMINHA